MSLSVFTVEILRDVLRANTMPLAKRVGFSTTDLLVQLSTPVEAAGAFKITFGFVF